MERHLSDESDDDTVQFIESDEKGECLDGDEFLWEKLAILTSISDDSIEVFEGYIDLFMQSEDDELFNQIMDRISSAIYIPIAIDHTLDKNYDTIVTAIGDKNKSCTHCDCIDHGGTNICDVVKSFIKLFIDMQNDELI